MYSVMICVLPSLALASGVPSPSASVPDPPQIEYRALSDAARASGQLALYEDCDTDRVRLEVGGTVLTARVPTQVRAYDVVPVAYDLRLGDESGAVFVEAVAGEDAERAGSTPVFDTAVPGDMRVSIEYLGHVAADYRNDVYIPLDAAGEAPASPFPPLDRDSLVRSGLIRRCGIVWFHFRLTNTGDTILSPEGLSGAFAAPVLHSLGEDGEVVQSGRPVNNLVRFLHPLYPGESVDLWTDVYCPWQGGAHNRGLVPGRYRLDLSLVTRYHKEWNYWWNIWHGVAAATLRVPLEVTETGGDRPVEAELEFGNTSDRRPGYLAAFEEFMTAFNRVPPGTEGRRVRDVVHVQVAPWTREITLKLILDRDGSIATVRVPVTVSQETLGIRYNPDNVMVLERDNGMLEPVFAAQAMPGMRSGLQLGPYGEIHMRERIREMKDLGVNVLINTSGGWWISELTGRSTVEMHSASYKYWHDTLVREEGMTLMGWSVYPPSSRRWTEVAEVLLGEDLEYATVVPRVIAAWAKYNYKRWGDLWFRTRDGRTIVDMEDSWGWMRDDINLRYLLGPRSLERFRDWVRDKYGTIEAANKAWNSDYASFDQIDPQVDQGKEGDIDGLSLPHGPVYNRVEHPFHDWSPACADWDRFRTFLRMDIVRKAQELMSDTIPNPRLCLRTEGANLVVPGDPESESPHLRHVYYSQRRNAMIHEVWVEQGVLDFHSDYTTLPYTEAEWRQAMRSMVKDGVIPVYLPQFDHMRDILLQDAYGRPYDVHYGYDRPVKGVMIHCLMAAYPWWKATYEEGGAPGIIWSDYLCDGFATETQKRELRLLRQHLNQAARDGETTESR
jgi:hypothetical protein